MGEGDILQAEVFPPSARPFISAKFGPSFNISALLASSTTLDHL